METEIKIDSSYGGCYSKIELENKPFVEVNANPFIETPKYKSELIIGNITVRFTKKFNLFNRIMLKLIFGLNIKNIKEKE